MFANLVAPRLGPVTEREPVPPLKFAQLVGFVFAVAGVIGFASGVTLLGLTATAFALVAAFLNAAFGICLGCQLYPLVVRLRRYALPRITPKHQATERISSMARSDVLVTADWAESNLDAPNTVFVEVDEDTSAYDGGHIAGAVKLDWRTDLQDPVVRDFVDAEQFSKLLS